MRLRILFGWALAALVSAMLGFAGVNQVAGAPMFVAMWSHFGYPHWFMIATGCFEILSAILLLVPRTAAFGCAFICLTMAGAIFTHMTHGQAGYVPLPLTVLLATLAATVLRSARPAEAGGGKPA